jgi:hypothetical protein
VFGNNDKREARSDAQAAAEAAFLAEVERLEALPMAQLAAEVMVKGFGTDGYLADFVQRNPNAEAIGVHAGNIAGMYKPKDARDAGLYKRLRQVVGEGVQVLEHESLIWAVNVREGSGAGYLPTRRGRAALETDAVEQILRGESVDSA